MLETQADVRSLLVGEPWLARSNLTVFLPEGTTVAQREAVRARLGAEAMHGSFQVTLEDPARIDQVHRALCGSRRTGDCPGGLVLLDHSSR